MLLSMRNISKSFPGVKALQEVDFDLTAGEVHALIGENGAGKSTLIKILGGAHRKDAGEITINETPVEITGPRHAESLGISVIYQEFNLIPFLTVGENIFLGREARKGIFVDYKTLYKRAGEILSQLGMNLNPRARVRGLSIAAQQMVEIAKAIAVQAKIIVMDEPSATLTKTELIRLFELIRALKNKGVGIIYISHRLEELFEIADRVTVFRDGRSISTHPLSQITREGLITAMVGRELKNEFPVRRQTLRGGELLRVEKLRRRGAESDVSLTLYKGEILGISGLVGAGRTELVRAIFGADPAPDGAVYLEGKKLFIKSPADAIKNGICLVTEDRKAQGLVLNMNVRENISITGLKKLCRFGFVDAAQDLSVADRFVGQLHIKTPHCGQRAKNLSGGNQQKVVLAKWLFTESRVIIFDEPTRGIDVGAKYEIYLLMHELLERGIGIIMISSELPEILGMSDRILVMRNGRIQGELLRAQATQESIMNYATGNGAHSAAA